MNTVTVTPLHGKNDTRFDELVDDVKNFAKLEGMAKDSPIKVGLKLVEAAYDGVIDLVADKHGKGIDDAAYIMEQAAMARRGAVRFDAKSDSGQVQISKARTCIKLGSWTKGGRGEPQATVNALMNMRDKLRKDPAQAKTLGDAYDSLLRYARAQIKLDRLIDDEEELKSFLLKAPKKLKNVEEALKAIQKNINALIGGKLQGGTLQYSDDDLQRANKNITKALRNCTTLQSGFLVKDDEGNEGSEEANVEKVFSGLHGAAPGCHGTEEEDAPVAHVSADVADAFGMGGLPNTVVHEEEGEQPIFTMDDLRAEQEAEEAAQREERAECSDRPLTGPGSILGLTEDETLPEDNEDGIGIRNEDEEPDEG